MTFILSVLCPHPGLAFFPYLELYTVYTEKQKCRFILYCFTHGWDGFPRYL